MPHYEYGYYIVNCYEINSRDTLRRYDVTLRQNVLKVEDNEALYPDFYDRIDGRLVLVYFNVIPKVGTSNWKPPVY